MRLRAGSILPAAGTAIGAFAAASALAFAWGSLVERRHFTLRRVRVPVLEPGTPPLRILHLSDLHMAPWQKDKQEWVRALADERPDLIVDTGDDLGHADGVRGIIRAYGRFAGVPGVYVHGSNDYFGPVPKNPFKYFTGPSRVRERAVRIDTAALERTLDGLGWTNLNNTATELVVRGVRLRLLGVDDPHRGYDRLDAAVAAADGLAGGPAISGAREHATADTRVSPNADVRGGEGAGAAPEPPALTIGVAHAPYRRILDAFTDHGARMLLAGHTHGGQVCVPGVGALVTNCDLPRDRVRGLSTWPPRAAADADSGTAQDAAGTASDPAWPAFLHVSAGLGTSIYAPVRFACLPEATLLTLVPRA